MKSFYGTLIYNDINFKHYDLKQTKIYKKISLLMLEFNNKLDGGGYLQNFKTSICIV